MKFISKILRHSNFWPILIVVLFSILAGRTLLTPGYFNMHDDLQMMRQLEMEKCFKDLQIPCRWVPDMGYGFGFPLFNFYPPLPYLVGEIIRAFGFSFVTTVKLIFLLSFIGSGVTMYLLAKEFFGRFGGVISSIFYIWAPYHAVDVYVRGAMNESWALIFFPLILWVSYKLIVEKQKISRWIIALSLSWFLLFTSHNLMIIIFTPVFAIWCLIFLWKEKNWKKILPLATSGILAFLLAAFFTLPALVEQKYVQVNTLVSGYYEYIAHFATLNQLLISRFWGYGASVWGDNDKMSFQIGHIHWILSIVLFIVSSLKIYKERKKGIIKNPLFIIPVFILIGWFAAFMTHSRSTFIWKMLPPLSFVQFPWRFLTLVVLCFSFVSGGITLLVSKIWLKIISFILLAALIILNWNYFLPEGGKMGPLTDKQKFSGAAWELQQTAGIFDYLPKSAKENPKEPQRALAECIEGKCLFSDSQQGTNWAKFKIKVDSSEAVVRIGIFDFPNWKVSLDGKRVEVFVPGSEKWGRMYVKIPKGEHQVYIRLSNTPIRIYSNFISLIAWLGLVSYPFWPKKK